MTDLLSSTPKNENNNKFFSVDLDDEQYSAVTSESSRLCILASAGSGKTRVVTKRIEYLCEQKKLLPSQIVAITFTRKAGFELATRLKRVFPTTLRERPIIGTLHSFAFSELLSYHEDNSSKLNSLLDDQTSFLKSLKIKNAPKVARAISFSKTRFLSIDQIDDDAISSIRRHCHIAPNALTKESFIKAYKAYEFNCKKQRLMDHDDVLLQFNSKLDIAEFRKTRQYLYRHLFVDEFQDTTPLHMEIYRKLVGDSGSITAVGDPDQSIFSFAGASDVYLNNFSEYFPGTQTVFLSTNYRSTKANVETARSVLMKPQMENIKAPRPSSVLPQLHFFPNDVEEAQNIIGLVAKTHAKGIAFNQIAVLVRTNEQKKLFVEHANKMAIPFHRGKEIINDPVAAEIINTIRNLRKKRRWKSIYDALDDIDGAQVIINPQDEETRETFKKLRYSAREYMNLFPHDRQGDVNGFFEFIESQLISERDRDHGFALLTFHQAKGLEFECVFVTGFEQGLVPLYNDKKRKIEESRLAYVALSRASDELHISRASVRNKQGISKIQKPSEFLIPIKEHISELDIRNDVFSADEAIKRIADIRAKYL